MNIITGILLVFFILGMMDSLTGDHLKSAAGFQAGMNQFGSVFLSISGFYCIGVTFVRHNMNLVVRLSRLLPFDPSVITSSVLETTMGGYPIAREIAQSPAMGNFSGILLSSSLGCLLSFQMPIVLNLVSSECIPDMFMGMVPGIITIVLGLGFGGALLGIQPGLLLVNLIPIIILCLIITWGIIQMPGMTQKIINAIGTVLRVMAMLMSLLVILGYFLPEYAIADQELSGEILITSLQLTVSVAGGMVISELVVNHCSGFLEAVAKKAGINKYSVLGLIFSLVSPVIMFPVFSKMDKTGKMMNAAFSVMGSYVIGGQMVYVSQMATTKIVAIYIFSKLLSGISAVALSIFFVRKKII